MRKVIRENKWRVSLITAQGQTIEKVLDAPSMAAAIGRAQQSFQGQQFVTATAVQLDPGLNVPSTNGSNSAQTAALPMQMRGLQQLAQPVTPAQALQARGQARESYAVNPNAFSYPYSVTLPMRFRKILAETSPVQVNESVGQFTITLEDVHDMSTFLEKLRINRDREAVRIIVSGIRSSMA